MSPSSETEDLEDVRQGRGDRHGRDGLRDGVVRVLQPVAGEGAHQPLARPEETVATQFYHACDGRRGGGLAEYAVRFGYQLVRVQDLRVADHPDEPAGL